MARVVVGSLEEVEDDSEEDEGSVLVTFVRAARQPIPFFASRPDRPTPALHFLTSLRETGPPLC